MVQGIEVDLFRPDDELKQLAQARGRARRRGALARLGRRALAPSPTRRGASGSPPGRRRRTRGSTSPRGSGMYSDDKVWLDHPEIPFGFVRDYVAQLQAGRGHRPADRGRSRAERDRITSEYRALLPDDDARAAFDEKLGLSRLVFPYVENHNFYIEHWSLSLFWRAHPRARAGARRRGLLGRGRRHLLPAPRRGPAGDLRLRQRLGGRRRARRARTTGRPRSRAARSIIAALSAKPPPPAMNEPPAVITEPFTIMLFGITTERVGAVAVGRRRRRRADRHGGLAGQRRGRRAGRSWTRRSSATLQDGRDPRHAHHRAELGAGVRPHRRGRHRHRRDDEPRGDRLPRVRAARGDRHRRRRRRRSRPASASRRRRRRAR